MKPFASLFTTYVTVRDGNCMCTCTQLSEHDGPKGISKYYKADYCNAQQNSTRFGTDKCEAQVNTFHCALLLYAELYFAIPYRDSKEKTFQESKVLHHYDGWFGCCSHPYYRYRLYGSTVYCTSGVHKRILGTYRS